MRVASVLSFCLLGLNVTAAPVHAAGWDLGKRRDLPFELQQGDWFDTTGLQSHWWTRAGRSILRWTGLPLPGKTLTYVWGGNHDPGASLPSPYRPDEGRVMVLRPAGSPLHTWQEERIDPVADYAKYFGSGADTPRFVAISGDSDNRGGVSSRLITLPVFR